MTTTYEKAEESVCNSEFRRTANAVDERGRTTVNLELNEEQKLLQKSVREFAETEVRPLAKELDETGHFPRELFKKAAELGLTGVAFPEAEGGAGFDHIAYAIVIEEISRCCASTGVILSVQNSLFCDPIHRFGN